MRWRRMFAQQWRRGFVFVFDRINRIYRISLRAHMGLLGFFLAEAQGRGVFFGRIYRIALEGFQPFWSQ